MSDDSAPPASLKLTTTQWLICIIASIGFAFDIYELLMLPLIVGPALQELIGAAPGSPEFNTWVGRLFYIPAIAGGVFGLVGGYLTDRLGVFGLRLGQDGDAVKARGSRERELAAHRSERAR